MPLVCHLVRSRYPSISPFCKKDWTCLTRRSSGTPQKRGAPQLYVRPHPMSENITSIDQETAEHYAWGSVCDGWHLLKHPELSVIQERVPPGVGEVKHYTRVLASSSMFSLARQQWSSTERKFHSTQVKACMFRPEYITASQTHQIRKSFSSLFPLQPPPVTARMFYQRSNLAVNRTCAKSRTGRLLLRWA